ncbi:FtsB/FtsL family cell division protein [Nocardiopsis halotolerans]|uniref:hypothetical protein n=1 Tax=Nocardiopsis halotolerans TaxID=124252 RepID=UPI00034A6A80|nr:hypothetical protein [Nocardiopsis halotolerans]
MSTRTDTRRASARSGKSAAKAADAKTATPRTQSARTGAPARPGRAAAPASGAATAPAARTRTGGAAQQNRAPRIPFVLLVLCLLGGTLVGLLLLRSVVAEGAFAIDNLQAENQELSYEQQQLRSTVAQLESSDRVSEQAEDRGMEQGDAPLFLDPESGEVRGSAGSGE